MPRRHGHTWPATILAGLLTAALLALGGGCASRGTVVLMPDPDGHVGKAEVATAGGKQLLERAQEMTVVSGSNPPTSPAAATPGYLAATFAEALAVEPLPSEKFILFFETGRTCLVAESQAAIPAILTAIKRRNAISITISGHTDAVGSVQLNDRLAHERALAIRGLLLQKGVDPQRLTVSSHGKGNPLIPTPDGVAEPRNRRVEVIVR
ncbi:OmpA family protein [Geobacter sp. FeAm09]|uniref:OmpA family protein n=1 Tax=Geobacter sp. FeAm09 TaxID=2597769 RepID=UPI0011ECE9CF|nr:OmpA family protein [Geobacter sp. FeAm09]QEM67320.1 OmpA family protein [Geobacter sp. FeAm09]